MARKRKGKKANPATRPGQDFSNRPLAGLKGLKPSKKPDQARSVKPKRDQDPGSRSKTETEDQEFEAAMSGVTPLGQRSTELPPAPDLPVPVPAAQREEREVIQALEDLVSGDEAFSIHQTVEAIEGLADGVDSRLLRKLKRGEYAIQAHLDLHGLTRQEARPVVTDFIDQAIARGQRCVLIIHGRGHGSKDKIPVLKNSLKTWLVRSGIRKSILAFSTAQAFDGGAGAIYVLLRKSRAIR